MTLSNCFDGLIVWRKLCFASKRDSLITILDDLQSLLNTFLHVRPEKREKKPLHNIIDMMFNLKLRCQFLLRVAS
jgi:hypothetical protein